MHDFQTMHRQTRVDVKIRTQNSERNVITERGFVRNCWESQRSRPNTIHSRCTSLAFRGDSVRRCASVASSAPVNSEPQLSGTTEHRAVCASRSLFTQLLKISRSRERVHVKCGDVKSNKIRRGKIIFHGYLRCCFVLTNRPPRGYARSHPSERKCCW